MIEFDQVRVVLGGKAVLNGFSLAVPSGGVTCILGKSGAGKSVALKTLVGLIPFQSGDIRVDGRSVRELGPQGWLEVRKQCAMVFQFPALLDSMTVRENLKLGLVLRGEESSAIDGRVQAALSQVGLDTSVLARYPEQLSQGVQKRISIARAVALQPKYLLFDEPTTGLDPIASSAIHDLIRQLATENGITTLVVSHDIRGALRVANQIVFLDGGKAVEQGTPNALSRSHHPLARAFLVGLTPEHRD